MIDIEPTESSRDRRADGSRRVHEARRRPVASAVSETIAIALRPARRQISSARSTRSAKRSTSAICAASRTSRRRARRGRTALPPVSRGRLDAHDRDHRRRGRIRDPDLLDGVARGRRARGRARGVRRGARRRSSASRASRRCTITPDELAAYYSADWAEKQLISGHGVLSAIVRRGKEPIEIPGPHRSFYVGPRVLLQLAPEQPRPALARSDPSRAVDPDAHRGDVRRPRSRMTARPIKLAVWLGEEVVFPAVDYAGISAIRTRQAEVFLIPAARVPSSRASAGRRSTSARASRTTSAADWPAIVRPRASSRRRP